MVKQQSQLLCLFGNAGHEGRIGMAAVIVREGEQLDGHRIYNHVVSYLPSYARPRFIRIQVIPVHMLQRSEWLCVRGHWCL